MSSTLRTHPSLYLSPSPSYAPPVELGYFSMDDGRCYPGDARHLRYLSPPAGMDSGGASPGWDLMDGFQDRYIPCNRKDVGLQNILTWVKENRERLRDYGSSHRLLDQDFLTRRGLLTKIMSTPYETNEGWVLAVTLFKGTLYINERETAEAYGGRNGRNLQHERFTYAGYKFESYMCADSPYSAPRPHDVVNPNKAFRSILQSRLASHSILVSGEVDCKDPASASPPSCYVELKTSVHIQTPQQVYNFRRYKLLKWWCQSFLLGIPTIIAGFRNQQGRVVSVQKFKTSEIPQLAQGAGQYWDPSVCLNFCNAFLDYIKKVVTTDDPRVVYLFSWKPGQDITFTIEKNSVEPVIPDWYVQELSQMSGSRRR